MIVVIAVDIGDMKDLGKMKTHGHDREEDTKASFKYHYLPQLFSGWSMLLWENFLDNTAVVL